MEALRMLTKKQGDKQGDSNYDIEVERLLSCPICLEVYSKPVVILPCQHNLCRKCANDVFQNRGTPMGSGGRFRCPTCRYEVMLDRHGVYGLQRNLLVENIIDMYQSESKKPFRKTELLMCEEHEEEKVNIFCITCQKPTCSLCKVFGQHQNCNVAPVDKVYKEHKTEISAAIAMLVSGNDRLQTVISKTEELTTKTEENSKKAQSDLCASFDKLYSVLEDRKQSLLSRIKAVTQEKVEVLQEMLRKYGSQLEGSSKLVEEALSLLEEPNAPQFLSISRELINRVTSTAQATEVRKPPSDIHQMNMFKVDFSDHESGLSTIDFPREDEDVNEEILDDEEDCKTTSDQNSVYSEAEATAATEVGFRAKLLMPEKEETEVVAAAEVMENRPGNTDGVDDTTSITSRSDAGSGADGRRDSSTSLGDAQLDNDVRAIAERYLQARANRSASGRAGSSASNDARRYSEENSENSEQGKSGRPRTRWGYRPMSPDTHDSSPVPAYPRPLIRSTATFQVGPFYGVPSPNGGNSGASSRSGSPTPPYDLTRAALLASHSRRRGSGNLSIEESPERNAVLSYGDSFSRVPESAQNIRARPPPRRNPRIYTTHRRRTWSHLLDKKN